MSIKDKLIEKLLNNSKTFSFLEARTLLSKLGFTEDTCGKTSGSRVAFYTQDKKYVIRLHKPHPGNEMKKYAKDELIETLRLYGYLD